MENAVTNQIIKVLGPWGSGKSTFIQNIFSSSTSPTSTKITSDKWVVKEGKDIVYVDFEEYILPQLAVSESIEVSDERTVFIVLLTGDDAAEDSIDNSTFSFLNQYYPSSIVFAISNLKRSRGDFYFYKLKSKYQVVRDYFEVDGVEEDGFRTFVWYLERMVLNEFTNRLELVRTKIRENILYRDKELDLGNCYLSNLYEVKQLFECSHLEKLVLSNEWAEFENERWRKIGSNNKGGRNRFRRIPIEFKKLTNLTVLIAGGDWNIEKSNFLKWSINNLHWIKGLNRLVFLNISNNEIANRIDITRFTKLQVVHLNNNKIKDVQSLEKLQLLEELYLSNNLIKNVSFLTELRNIKTIDLHANYIIDITVLQNLIEKLDVTNTKWIKGTLNVAKNPLEKPPIEIINIGKKAVLQYFLDIQVGQPYINDEIKLILVGNSEVGKTTLAKYLDREKDLDKEHPFTLWMQEKKIQSKYKVKKIGKKCWINLFDFGGHDYYHDTHHLLFGSNCVYIVLWDKRTNNLGLRTTVQKFGNELTEIEIETQDYPLKYWLDSVKYFVKEVGSTNFDFDIEKSDGYNSLAVIVQNKVSRIEDVVHLNNGDLFEEYPFIFDFINISILKERRNLSHFDTLLNEMLDESVIVGQKLPGYYGVIKASLENYNQKPILNLEEFKDYCNSKLNITITVDQAHSLAFYLKQLGQVLYFPKNLPSDKVFVRKEWIIESLQLLIKKLKNRKGEFDERFLFQLLNSKLTTEEIFAFIDLLIEFKIVFKHPIANTFIAPLYLPNSPSSAVKLFLDENKRPYRRIIYNSFILKNVTLSLFQQYGQLALNEQIDSLTSLFYYWKDGLIIKDPTTRELILIQFFIGDNDGNAFIDIIKLNKLAKTDFSDKLVEYIKLINKDSDIEEMVTIDGTNYISIDILNDNAEQGRWIFTYKSKRELKQVKKPTTYFQLKDYYMFLKDGIKKKKVVISYSKKDLVRVHTFIRYLRPLVDLDLIEEPWYCTLSNPADEWDEKIQIKFKEADIVFFMVSEYFYSTGYIVEKEIKTSIDRYDFDKSVKIIPIILEHYDWERKTPYNLKRFSALPFQAKPLSDFNNEKLAWNTITAAVRKMIEKDLDPGEIDLISREMQEFYERQVEGKLNRNS